MTRVSDLLSVLHQIDSLRGKICQTCYFYTRHADGGNCRHPDGDRVPFGADDGCDDWQSNQGIIRKA